jgi:hypothetical protein
MDDTIFLQNYRFKNKPFLHQEAYLQRFWRSDVAALFADMGTGTGVDANGQMQVQSIDQPYVERVRQFRQSRTPLAVGFSQFDPRFSRQVDPTLREAYFQNEQTRLGVPASSLAWEAQRFTPMGGMRGFQGY